MAETNETKAESREDLPEDRQDEEEDGGSEDEIGPPDEYQGMAEIYATLPLDPTAQEIRLLTLWSGQTGDELICSLSKVSLLDSPKYVAVSYAWGDLADTKTIIISTMVSPEGGDVLVAKLYVTNNLEAALRNFHDANFAVLFWIDAVCVNQRDIAERNAQVQTMGQIFQSALFTSIWLGDGGARGQEAMALIQRIVENGMSVVADEENHDAWEALPIVLQCAWWHRAWVIQEFVLSGAEPVFWCGRAALTWRYLRSFETKFRAFQQEAFHYADAKYQGVELAYGDNQIQRLQLLYDIPAEARSFNRLLPMTSVQVATDPRDHIYALLGLTTEKHSIDIVPDYAAPVVRVYADFVRAVIKAQNRLEILFFKKPRIRDDLPSWVPDFSSWQETKRTNAMELMVLANAHAGIPPKVQFSAAYQVLTLAGLLFDHVDNVIPKDEPVEAHCRLADSLATSLSEFSHLVDNAYSSLRRDFSTLRVIFANRCWWTEDKARVFDVFVHRREIPDDYSPDLPPRNIELENFRRIQYVYPILEDLAYALDGRSFFTTRNGFMGMGPADIRADDQIVVAGGCGTPLVLRKAAEGHFTLVGPCYVPAIMEGQLVELKQPSVSLEDFEIR